MKTWFSAFATLAALAALTRPVARCQTSLPDLYVNYINDLGGPRPNGRIYASIANNGPTTVTADAVAYRGSVAAGRATEVVRHSFTFAPGSAFALDTGTTIPFAEG